MTQQAEQIWETLLKVGVVQGQAPESEELESPWYVKVLLAFSGWLSALFLLFFIFAGFDFIRSNSFAALIIGGMMIAGALFILRSHKNEFVEHMALATSLAGQALIVFEILDTSERQLIIAWTMVALLQLLLTLIASSFVHRVFSSFVTAFAFSMALSSNGLHHVFSGVVMLLAVLCWFNEFKYPQHMRKIRAIGYGLVLALILFKCTALFGQLSMDFRFIRNQPELWGGPWPGELLIGLVTLYVVWHLLQMYGKRITEGISVMTLLATLFVCGLSLEAQGITVGIVVLLLGFSGSNRVLMGLGIISLLFYISSYYYLLDATLLDKSITLIILSMFLFVVRWLMLSSFPAKSETLHA